ncbi:MAG: hypothetical protein WB988_18965 [Candidatus Nitrosopolaris sp.]
MKACRRLLVYLSNPGPHVIKIYGLAILFDIIGMQGDIRREADMPIVFHWAMSPLLFFALTIGMTQFLFVYNFVKTLHRNYTKRELEEYDELHKNPDGLGINVETNLDGG